MYRKSLFLFLTTLVIATFNLSANTPQPTVGEETQQAKPMRLYTYFYRLLPDAAHSCSPFNETKDFFLKPEMFDRMLERRGYTAPYTHEQITVNTTMHEARQIIVWQLPQPNQPTIPIYVAFVPDGEHYRYFTFEYAMDKDFKFGNDYVLGEQTPEQHKSYGSYPLPEDWHGFADLIIARFLSSDNPEN